MTTTEPRDYSVDQMAVGFALGAALGLTPLLSLHNLVFLAAPIVLRLSLSTFLIAWIGAIPFGLSARSIVSPPRVRPALLPSF